MLALRMLPLSLLVPVCLACQAVAAPLGSSVMAIPAGDPFPPAQEAIEVRIGEGGNDRLAELVVALGNSTGVSFVMTESVKGTLMQTYSGLTGSVQVPAAQAWPWIEGLLVHHGYVLSVQSTEAPYLIGVVNTRERQGPTRSLSVTRAELDAFAAHPAMLIRTTLELPDTDVRQLGNSMRAMTADPSGTQSIIPVGNTNSIVVSGTGASVTELVAILEEVDRVAREAREEYEREHGESSESQTSFGLQRVEQGGPPSSASSGAPGSGQ